MGVTLGDFFFPHDDRSYHSLGKLKQTGNDKVLFSVSLQSHSQD